MCQIVQRWNCKNISYQRSEHPTESQLSAPTVTLEGEDAFIKPSVHLGLCKHQPPVRITVIDWWALPSTCLWPLLSVWSFPLWSRFQSSQWRCSRSSLPPRQHRSWIWHLGDTLFVWQKGGHKLAKRPDKENTSYILGLKYKGGLHFSNFMCDLYTALPHPPLQEEHKLSAADPLPSPTYTCSRRTSSSTSSVCLWI